MTSPAEPSVAAPEMTADAHGAAAPHAAGGGHLPFPPGSEGCLEILAERLRVTPGVVGVDVDFRNAMVTVRYESARIDPDHLNAFADEIAALFAQRVTGCERRVTADSCGECAIRLGHLSGGNAADYAVTASPEHVGLTRRVAPGDSLELRRTLAARKPWGATLSLAELEHLSRGRAMATTTAVGLGLLAIGMILDRISAPPIAAKIAFGLSAAVDGWFAVRSTARALMRLRFDVNLLMILAAIGAAVIGYVFEAAVLMFLFSLSNTLEVYTMGRTRRALHALLKLRPSLARVVRDGREIEVDAEAVEIGDRVIVKPGEAMPVDGVVTAGESLVDQSSLTGESMPVTRVSGDRVFAGTLNQQGALEVRATRAASDTTLARIVALVREAQEQKSRTEELAEWVGRYYTVVVMIAAAAMIIVPFAVLHLDFMTSFYRAMTLLVVASPCALVIATPATILSAIANAARNGVLFKGGRFIEALGRVKTVAFDKTGTLTRGRFEVTDVVAIEGASEEDVLAWAAGAEKRSPHPLAQAVVRAAETRGIRYRSADQCTNHLGKGLTARIDGAPVEIGTPDLFAFLGVPVPQGALDQVARFHEAARTAMIVRRGEAWGVIAAADEPRPSAVETIAALKREGIDSVVLLSGDHARTVEAIARRTGIDRQFGSLLPEDKVNRIAELESGGSAVAMVGDGINDAPALARATVGVVMGGIGSDAALESADVVLMSDDLTALPYAVRLCRHARRVVIQNVSIASGVMVLLVTWVFLGAHTPIGALKLPVAVSGHEGSTVVVILNGLRLLGEKRTR
ncbi:MAG TPA: heavy metal translocating P-type ATPase [Candidatus Udaeobacter sp.]|jgi:Cd2+/Zn2+-exporting ATPase|nr:heavy metal translocating P-type ATPase [Candidatus Udaeobacter sp.]